VTCDPPLTDACCDPADGLCKADPQLDPSCVPPEVGCRITGGRIVNDLTGQLDPDLAVTKATGGGQVGAPCGCIGCFDPDTCGSGNDDCIQGNWEHSRKKKQGSFKATDFASLQCGCEACASDGVTTEKKFDGSSCNDSDRSCGPTPPNAPANLICFSGTGTWSPTCNKKTVDVAFRVEAEDHGEPGGQSGDATTDEYRIWIYFPNTACTGNNNPSACCTGKGTGTCGTIKALEAGICCQSAPTTGTAAATFNVGRTADVFDGNNLVHGNLQIHREVAGHAGECPVTNDSCPAPVVTTP
jgi:hypothetical protein